MFKKEIIYFVVSCLTILVIGCFLIPSSHMTDINSNAGHAMYDVFTETCIQSETERRNIEATRDPVYGYYRYPSCIGDAIFIACDCQAKDMLNYINYEDMLQGYYYGNKKALQRINNAQIKARKHCFYLFEQIPETCEQSRIKGNI